MATLRSFESDLREGLLDPGGITRKKAEGWHPLEVLSHIEGRGFVYLVVGNACESFQTVDEAMTFIENYWGNRKRETRDIAEYLESPSLLSPEAEIRPIDEWE